MSHALVDATSAIITRRSESPTAPRTGDFAAGGGVIAVALSPSPLHAQHTVAIATIAEARMHEEFASYMPQCVGLSVSAKCTRDAAVSCACVSCGDTSGVPSTSTLC